MLGFWKSKFDNSYLAHKNGLTKDQVAFLKSLEEGDRLIVYTNDKKDRESQSDLTLKIYRKKSSEEETL